MPDFDVDCHYRPTSAERAVLRLLAAHGLSNDELADRLGITRPALDSRLHRFYEHSGIPDRATARVWAVLHFDCCLKAG